MKNGFTLKTDTGSIWNDVKVFYERIIQNQNKDDFISLLKDKTLVEINRLGKYLIFEFSDDLYMISHLRMEGKYFIKPATDEIVKHEHIVFIFSDGVSLRFHDVRKFGTMELKNKNDVYTTHPLLNLGMEATCLTKEYLYEKGFKDGMRHVEECVFYMTAYTLYYKLNWDNLKSGEKKLRQIMYDIFNNIDAFRTGHLTRSDYEEIKEQIKKMKVELK